jgi:hypothetical protein
MQEEEEWVASTQLPYDPFASCAVLQNHQFDCPNCNRLVAARKSASSNAAHQRSLHYTAFLSDTGGTGYAQKGFVINCSACNFHITRQTLAVAKFARDLVLDPNDPSDSFLFKCAVYLPYAIFLGSFYPVATNMSSGTLLDYSGRLSASAAKESKDRLSRAEVFRNNHPKQEGAITELTDPWERDVKRKLNFSLFELQKNLDLCLLPSKCVVRFIPQRASTIP